MIFSETGFSPTFGIMPPLAGFMMGEAAGQALTGREATGEKK